MKKLLLILFLTSSSVIASNGLFIGKKPYNVMAMTSDTNVAFVRSVTNTDSSSVYIFNRKDVNIIYKFYFNAEQMCVKQVTILPLRYSQSVSNIIKKDYKFEGSNVYINKNKENHLKVNRTNLSGFITLELY